MLSLKMKLPLAFVLAAISSSNALAAPPCDANDAPCLRLKLLEADERIQNLERQIELHKQLFAIREQQITLLNTQNDALYAALEKSLKLTNRAWYEHPALWTAIGITLGTGFTVLGGYAVAQAAR